MAGVVYVLSAVTCLISAGLLWRGYARSRERLLLWSGLCFLGLAADNALLFVDVILLPDISLFAWRGLPALAGLAALVYGLVWETR